jgi:small subunit ribosomal protein S21
MKGDGRKAREVIARRVTIVDGAAVVLEPGQPIDSALKKLARHVQRAGILRELKRREHYIPPSATRRVKSRRARKRAAKVSAIAAGAE